MTKTIMGWMKTWINDGGEISAKRAMSSLVEDGYSIKIIRAELAAAVKLGHLTLEDGVYSMPVS